MTLSAQRLADAIAKHEAMLADGSVNRKAVESSLAKLRAALEMETANGLQRSAKQN